MFFSLNVIHCLGGRGVKLVTGLCVYVGILVTYFKLPAEFNGFHELIFNWAESNISE